MSEALDTGQPPPGGEDALRWVGLPYPLSGPGAGQAGLLGQRAGVAARDLLYEPSAVGGAPGSSVLVSLDFPDGATLSEPLFPSPAMLLGGSAQRQETVVDSMRSYSSYRDVQQRYLLQRPAPRGKSALRRSLAAAEYQRALGSYANAPPPEPPRPARPVAAIQAQAKPSAQFEHYQRQLQTQILSRGRDLQRSMTGYVPQKELQRLTNSFLSAARQTIQRFAVAPGRSSPSVHGAQGAQGARGLAGASAAPAAASAAGTSGAPGAPHAPKPTPAASQDSRPAEPANPRLGGPEPQNSVAKSAAGHGSDVGQPEDASVPRPDKYRSWLIAAWRVRAYAIRRPLRPNGVASRLASSLVDILHMARTPDFLVHSIRTGLSLPWRDGAFHPSLPGFLYFTDLAASRLFSREQGTMLRESLFVLSELDRRRAAAQAERARDGGRVKNLAGDGAASSTGNAEGDSSLSWPAGRRRDCAGPDLGGLSGPPSAPLAPSSSPDSASTPASAPALSPHLLRSACDSSSLEEVEAVVRDFLDHGLPVSEAWGPQASPLAVFYALFFFLRAVAGGLVDTFFRHQAVQLSLYDLGYIDITFRAKHHNSEIIEAERSLQIQRQQYEESQAKLQALAEELAGASVQCEDSMSRLKEVEDKRAARTAEERQQQAALELQCMQYEDSASSSVATVQNLAPSINALTDKREALSQSRDALKETLRAAQLEVERRGHDFQAEKRGLVKLQKQCSLASKQTAEELARIEKTYARDAATLKRHEKASDDSFQSEVFSLAAYLTSANAVTRSIAGAVSLSQAVADGPRRSASGLAQSLSQGLGQGPGQSLGLELRPDARPDVRSDPRPQESPFTFHPRQDHGMLTPGSEDSRGSLYHPEILLPQGFLTQGTEDYLERQKVLSSVYWPQDVPSISRPPDAPQRPERPERLEKHGKRGPGASDWDKPSAISSFPAASATSATSISSVSSAAPSVSSAPPTGPYPPYNPRDLSGDLPAQSRKLSARACASQRLDLRGICAILSEARKMELISDRVAGAVRARPAVDKRLGSRKPPVSRRERESSFGQDTQGGAGPSQPGPVQLSALLERLNQYQALISKPKQELPEGKTPADVLVEWKSILELLFEYSKEEEIELGIKVTAAKTSLQATAKEVAALHARIQALREARTFGEVSRGLPQTTAQDDQKLMDGARRPKISLAPGCGLGANAVCASQASQTLQGSQHPSITVSLAGGSQMSQHGFGHSGEQRAGGLGGPGTLGPPGPLGSAVGAVGSSGTQGISGSSLSSAAGDSVGPPSSAGPLGSASLPPRQESGQVVVDVVIRKGRQPRGSERGSSESPSLRNSPGPGVFSKGSKPSITVSSGVPDARRFPPAKGNPPRLQPHAHEPTDSSVYSLPAEEPPGRNATPKLDRPDRQERVDQSDRQEQDRKRGRPDSRSFSIQQGQHQAFTFTSDAEGKHVISLPSPSPQSVSLSSTARDRRESLHSEGSAAVLQQPFQFPIRSSSRPTLQPLLSLPEREGPLEDASAMLPRLSLGQACNLVLSRRPIVPRDVGPADSERCVFGCAQNLAVLEESEDTWVDRRWYAQPAEYQAAGAQVFSDPRFSVLFGRLSAQGADCSAGSGGVTAGDTEGVSGTVNSEIAGLFRGPQKRRAAKLVPDQVYDESRSTGALREALVAGDALGPAKQGKNGNRGDAAHSQRASSPAPVDQGHVGAPKLVVHLDASPRAARRVQHSQATEARPRAKLHRAKSAGSPLAVPKTSLSSPRMQPTSASLGPQGSLPAARRSPLDSLYEAYPPSRQPPLPPCQQDLLQICGSLMALIQDCSGQTASREAAFALDDLISKALDSTLPPQQSRSGSAPLCSTLSAEDRREIARQRKRRRRASREKSSSTWHANAALPSFQTPSLDEVMAWLQGAMEGGEAGGEQASEPARGNGGLLPGKGALGAWAGGALEAVPGLPGQSGAAGTEALPEGSLAATRAGGAGHLSAEYLLGSLPGGLSRQAGVSFPGQPQPPFQEPHQGSLSAAPPGTLRYPGQAGQPGQSVQSGQPAGAFSAVPAPSLGAQPQGQLAQGAVFPAFLPRQGVFQVQSQGASPLQPTFFQAPQELPVAPPFQQYGAPQIPYGVQGFAPQVQPARPYQEYYASLPYGYPSQYVSPGGYGAYPYYPAGM